MEQDPGNSVDKETLIVLESNVSNSDIPEKEEMEQTIITKTTIVETYFEIPDSYKNTNATVKWILESEELSHLLEGNDEGEKLVTEGYDEGEKLVTEGYDESEKSGGHIRIIEKVIEELPDSSEEHVIGNGEHRAIEHENEELPDSIEENVKDDGNGRIIETEVSKILTGYEEEPELDVVEKKITTIIEEIPEGYVKGEGENGEGEYLKGDGGRWIVEEFSGTLPDSAEKYAHVAGENTSVEETVNNVPEEYQKGGRWVFEEVPKPSKGGEMGKWIVEENGEGIPNSGNIFTQGNEGVIEEGPNASMEKWIFDENSGGIPNSGNIFTQEDEGKWIIQEGGERIPNSDVRYVTENAGKWVTYEDGGRTPVSDEGYAQGKWIADGNGVTEIFGAERPHGEGLIIEKNNQDFVVSGDRYVPGDDEKSASLENEENIELSGNKSSGLWVYDFEPDSTQKLNTLNNTMQTVDPIDEDIRAPTLHNDIPDSATDIVNETTADGKKKKKNRKRKWVFIKKNATSNGVNQTTEVTPGVVTKTVGDSNFKDGLQADDHMQSIIIKNGAEIPYFNGSTEDSSTWNSVKGFGDSNESVGNLREEEDKGVSHIPAEDTLNSGVELLHEDREVV